MVGLPCLPLGLNVVWVIVDRLTKSAHILAIHGKYSLEMLARFYVDEIVKLHGVIFFYCFRL